MDFSNSLKIILILFASILFAQEKLKVEYEITPYYEPAVKDDFSVASKTSYYELIVDNDESQYIYLERIDNTQKQPEAGMISGSFEMRSDGTLYKNTRDRIWIEDVNFEGNAFLIKDSLVQIDWKISKETREISGFPVLKAAATLNDINKTEIVAWYSPKLNFKNGPDKFWGLPGLILEAETIIKHADGGKEGAKYSAVKVETLNSKDKIKIPTKGKVISEKEFYDFTEKYYQRMMEMIGGGVDKD